MKEWHNHGGSANLRLTTQYEDHWFLCLTIKTPHKELMKNGLYCLLMKAYPKTDL